ncbi:MAG: Arsenical pump family protein [Bacillales bacterium]|jgi:Na+/H+ antiporter NhaD/arsenite permease-like protein|nr:Arsenical pump family protein [Bacillales bacterium]
MTATQDVSNFHYFAAIAIFLVTYALIISEKVNRAVIALLGACVMILLGILELHAAFVHHIDWATITLLVGMMILVNITSKSGVFEFLAIKAAKIGKGEPKRILIYLALLTAVGSAFLDNVTTVLLIVPVTLSITNILRVNPIPYLITEIIFSNVGGTATLIGDPPNIMIGNANRHLDFNAFLFNMAPVVLMMMPVVMGYLYFFYRRQLVTKPERISELMALDEKSFIKDRKLLIKSVSVLLLTIVGFMLHSVIHVEAAVVAMTGATVLMLIAVNEHDLEELFASVEWTTIFFFVGLFTLVGGLIDVGIITQLAEKMLAATDGDIGLASVFILWVSGIASATIDNIPFVATMIPLIKDLSVGMGYTPSSSEVDVLWWSLALGACLGGNGTIIGASANVIVSGMAAREGNGFSYFEFLRIGAPITIITLLISHAYIFIRYL